MGMLLITAAMLVCVQDQQIEVEVVDTGEPHVMVMQIADTREQTEAKAAERFAARDADGNGYLEGEERRAIGLDLPHLPRMAMMEGHPMPAMPKMDPAEMFAKIDSDGNGSISREEFAAHHEAHGEGHAMPRVMMHRIEREGEGPHEVTVNRWITKDGEDKEEVIVKRLGEGEALELKSGEGEKHVVVRRMREGGEWTDAEGKTVMLDRVGKIADWASEDADGDGRVSREEAIAKALERFDAMDKDGDGTLGEDERVNVFAFRRMVERKD